MLLGWRDNYPGPAPARLMVQGFFAGFMFGFLGTSMPRLLGVAPLRAVEAFGLLGLYVADVAAQTAGQLVLGDALFALELALWSALLKGRCHAKCDLPPPTFVLVGLAFGCGFAGAALHLAARRWEFPPELELLTRLLSYHAFVLLCVLGAGGFLLPRFLGLGLRREFPTSSTETPEWRDAAQFARATGAIILATYLLEATGWPRVAVTLRASVTVSYLWH